MIKSLTAVKLEISMGTSLYPLGINTSRPCHSGDLVFLLSDLAQDETSTINKSIAAAQNAMIAHCMGVRFFMVATRGKVARALSGGNSIAIDSRRPQQTRKNTKI